MENTSSIEKVAIILTIPIICFSNADKLPRWVFGRVIRNVDFFRMLTIISP